VSEQKPTSIVITDTSILINLSHTGHLAFLGKVSGLRFAVPDEVFAEIVQPQQLKTVEAVVADGSLQRESIRTPEELSLFAELSQVLGSGEAACLALAVSRGWIISSLAMKSVYSSAKPAADLEKAAFSTLSACMFCGFALACSAWRTPTGRRAYSNVADSNSHFSPLAM
jgi:hypothetical protein